MANLKYLECDFYSIEEQHGEKYVHIYGYFYSTDCQEDGKDYRLLEYGWLYLPISLFPDNYEKEYEKMMVECKQYIDDLTEEECEEQMTDWASGCVELPLDEVTPDTPCGDYVSYK